MPDNDEHDTEQAPTTAADGETTELAPAARTAAELAWSVDDDTAEVEPPHRGSILVWSALVALVVVIAGALIFLGITLFGSRHSNPVAPLTQPTSSTVPVAAPLPAPSTVTVTAEAPPAPSVVAPTTTEHADIRVNPLCWFGTMGAVAPCGEGYGNGNGQLTPAEQLQQCKLLAQLPPTNLPNWYASTCVRAD
jgi:hypothetical protein